jgi:ABC-type molybdate transport system permease subunit
MNPAAALAATAVSLNKKPTSRSGWTVQQAISLSPTIFPIIFAAIIGRFLKALGLFGAERGIKLRV